MKAKWEQRRKRIFEIIEVGSNFDFQSRGYDLINAAAIVLNLTVSILYTFEDMRMRYSSIFLV